MEIFRADDGDGILIVRLLEPHEIERNKKFYFEVYGEPALSADQVARMALAVARNDE